MTSPARKGEQNRVEIVRNVRRATRVRGSMTGTNPARNGKPHGPMQKEIETRGPTCDGRHILVETYVLAPHIVGGTYLRSPWN